MNPSRLPTLAQIERLTSFLPRLYADGFSPIERWSSGEKQNDGSFTLSYPEYHPLVEAFFRHISSDGWLDHDYNPDQAWQMLQDENRVRAASLPEIKSMLTFCVRGERFSDGHWGQMIEKGYVRRLLERLNEIKSKWSA